MTTATTRRAAPVPGLPEGRTPGAGLPQVSVVTLVPRTATVLVVPTRPGEDGAELVREPELGPDVTDLRLLLGRERAQGSRGEVVAMPLPASAPYERFVAVGLGADDDQDQPATLRKLGAGLARRLSSAATVTVDLRGMAVSPAAVASLAEGVQLASYSFRLAAPKGTRLLQQVFVLVEDRSAKRVQEQQQAVERGTTRSRATLAARDLVNAPPAQKTPQWLAERAQELLGRLDVRVRDERELAAEGFGGIVAVGQGSSRPPRFIEAHYDGSRAATDGRRVPHVVLVGKGITFDTGGLSLKRGDGMVTMKNDMGGAAAVLCALRAVSDLGLPLRVTALVSAAENMPSGDAQRPGDVITQYGGRTVEVLNTDAEGRLVLADALAYADTVLDADVIVDVATLTGAMPVALGKVTAGMFSSDDRLAGQLEKAAKASGEKLWRMPLVEDYRHALDSGTADLRNIGDPRRKLQGGSITAALFLREFTGGRPWAHLDIAGPAWSGGDSDELTKGGTGYGVRLLTHWLESLATSKR